MEKVSLKIRDDRGISSLELAVVLALIAIMATFTIPYLGSWLKHYRVVGASRELTSKIQEARIKAISDNVEWRVVIDQDNDTYSLQRWDSATSNWVTEGGTHQLPKNVIFVSGSGGSDASGKMYIRFKPSGTAGHNTDGTNAFSETDVSIYVKGETADVYMIEIRSLTGCVAISHWNGTGWVPT